ncbi:MAG: lactonase family protein [Flavobacteriaceae bacterium]|nr:lactonase family protein [Flavobacteriaceae bacterium]
MNKLTFFMGSYTEYLMSDFGGIGNGISIGQLNLNTGKLKVLDTYPVRNPSYLTISKDNRFLYGITELHEKEKPKVKAYYINDDFSLEFLNEQTISGIYPCHLKIFDKNVLVVCYGTGNVIQFPLDATGKLMKSLATYHHKGSSINKTRQEGPHAHQVVIHPNQEDIFVCDLGIDIIKAYQFYNGKLVPNEQKDITLTKGGGPRHMVFDKEGKLGYVLNELSSNISVVQLFDDVFEEVFTIPTLPLDDQRIPSASAIRLHPNGKFLYTANRGAELISIFSISGAQLIGYQYTKGQELREFNITPNGKWLIACHQNSHETVVFEIMKNGTLSEKYRTKEILSPVCLTFPSCHKNTIPS